MMNINKMKYQSAQVTIFREVLEFLLMAVQTPKLVLYIYFNKI